jgi:23S rRNA pseudouridine1911/1915/1917 synthase
MLNRGYAYTTTISSKYHGQTLLSHLASLYPHSTPEVWQQNLNNAEVTLNGVTASGSESVTSGQTLVGANQSPLSTSKSCSMTFICWPSTNPAGCPHSPAAASWKTPSCAWCKSNSPTQALSTGWAEAPAASSSSKTRQAASNLEAKWNTPNIQKLYRALAQNIAQRDACEILTPIGLVPHPRLGSVWATNPSGKPSKSLAKVISRTTCTTTFEVSLYSGRPHQIRIHFASIGHPLVGDPLYGSTGQPHENLPGLPGDGGYFLHAQFLKFHHPITGEQINLEAALPFGFSLHQ